jgi:multicomponent K+:H+ antiporter subunit A
LEESTRIAIASLVVLAPALGGALLFVSGRALERWAGVVGVAGSVIAFAAAAWLIAVDAEGVAVAWELAPSMGIRVSWRLGIAPLALAGLVAGIGALVMQFGHAYFGARPKGQRAIATLSLFQAAMLGLVLSDDLLMLFTFWELTGLCSFFLIQTDADVRDDTFPAAQQALIVTVAGALPMLLGFIHLGFVAGTSSLTELAAVELSVADQSIAFVLILLGVLTKSAQVPFHFWLPGAMAAPTPISAYLHSATMVKAGLILLLYLYPICGDAALWSALLVPIGVVTCVWGSWCALGQGDIKLLMAWSTVSQLGLMTMTIGLGTDLAIRAAALHLFAHGIFKAGLFLSIGAIDHAAHTRELSELGGLARRAPWLAGVAGLLAGSMAGLPPFAGFLSKELVLEKLTLADPIVDDVAVLGIVIGSIGTVAYTSRFFFGTFFGAPRSGGAESAHTPELAFVFAPTVLAVLSLAAGLAAPWTDRWLLEPFSASLLGHSLEAPRLALWHGFTVPFVLSIVIVTLGYAADRWLGSHPLPLLPTEWQGPGLFARGLSACMSFGGVVNRALAGAPPALYLGFAVALGFGAGWPLIAGIPDAAMAAWPVAPAVVAALLCAAVVLVLVLGDQLPRVLALTAVGLCVALLYGYLLGPDLVLTQLLVDILTTVFFVLALRFVAKRGAEGSSERDEERPLTALAGSLGALLSVFVGLVAAGIVIGLWGLTPDTRLADTYYEVGPAVAKGKNLVNLVLADFRGLDTAGETLVVLLTAVGVSALIGGGEVGQDSVFGERMRSSYMLEGLARLIVPLAMLIALAMLLKGHDQPGGGFVAGLCVAVGAILAMASGQDHRPGVARWRTPEAIAILGAAIIGIALASPMLAGESMLTHHHGELRIGEWLLYKWTTTLLFEIGVALIVGAGLAAAATRLATARSATGSREA